MNEKPTLDLLVATHRPEGILRVAQMVLPPIAGVRYVVSWQNHQDAPVPEVLKRPDVTILRFDGVGLSANRNNALAHCTAEVVLISDDDVICTPKRIDALRCAFRDNPQVDVATFRSDHDDMSRFPTSRVTLQSRLPKGYSVTSFEIAFRRERIGNLCFCPELGLGSPTLHGGEDEVFLLSAIRRGLTCIFFPITICAHPHPSTGTKARITPQNQMAQGAVIRLSNPATWLLRIPLKAWRLSRRGQAPLLQALFRGLQGALQVPSLRRRNPESIS